MPVMGFTKFECFLRAAGGVDVDQDDIKRYLDFVNDALYDLLLIGQATAKANVRDVILPWDLPVTGDRQQILRPPCMLRRSPCGGTRLRHRPVEAARREVRAFDEAAARRQTATARIPRTTTSHTGPPRSLTRMITKPVTA